MPPGSIRPPHMDVLRTLVSSDRTVAGVVDGLDVVCKLLENIARAPEEPRYRRVRKGNARIALLLGREEEGLLRAAGFKDTEDDVLECLSENSEGPNAELGVAMRACEVLEVIEVARTIFKEKLN